MGLNVRVGMEDNVYYRRGQLVDANAQLVERTVRITRELERRPATPAEARVLLGVRGREPGKLPRPVGPECTERPQAGSA
jgi:3-keto-5-aminohexanoate cleavage enzyme